MDTNAIDILSRLGIAGVKPTDVERVSKAVLHAVSGLDPEGSRNGGNYVLPDDGLVLWIPSGTSVGKVYELIKERVERDMMCVFWLSFRNRGATLTLERSCLVLAVDRYITTTSLGTL